MELLALTVDATILKPRFTHTHFTVCILSIYGRFLSSSFSLSDLHIKKQE